MVRLCVYCYSACLHAPCFSQAEEITEAEKKAFKQVFDTFDKNKDGHISIGELKAVMNRLGHNPSDEDLAGFVKECDVNKNGTIQFSEFCHCLFRLRKTVSSHKCKDSCTCNICCL